MAREIHIVFDGPPGPEGGRFIEVEDERGSSVKVGRWEQVTLFRGVTQWVLVITAADAREVFGDA